MREEREIIFKEKTLPLHLLVDLVKNNAQSSGVLTVLGTIFRCNKSFTGC